MRSLFALFVTFGMVLSSLIGAVSGVTAQTAYSPEDLLAIKPHLREQVAASLPAGMTEYEIAIDIPNGDPASGLDIRGRQRVMVTNTTGEPLTELPFRIYANGANSQHNALEITSVQINDEDVPWELSVSNTVASVPLADGLEPGESVTIAMDFTISLPVDDPTHYGIFNHSTENDTSVLAHWYPVLAGRDPVTGWMLKPTSVFGDPIFTDAGMYEVSISAPAGRTLITSGVETDSQLDGDRQSVTFSAKPSRDFVIVMSDSLQSSTTEVDGTTITSWALPNHQAAGDAVLEWTANSLNVFNPLLGEYPWLQLHAIEAVVFSAAAVELPQMFIMGSNYYTNPDLNTAISYFEFTVAHEVVHMWFYSLVGNNQYADAFIDEGLTNYLSGDVYFRHQYGDSTGDAAFQMFLYRPFERMIEANADVIVDFPTDSFPTSQAYVSAVYSKAPLGFHAIHTAMGDDAFFDALSEYVTEFSFRVATPADMEAAFQNNTEVDIRQLWSHWFEKREGALDIGGARP